MTKLDRFILSPWSAIWQIPVFLIIAPIMLFLALLVDIETWVKA